MLPINFAVFLLCMAMSVFMAVVIMFNVYVGMALCREMVTAVCVFALCMLIATELYCKI